MSAYVPKFLRWFAAPRPPGRPAYLLCRWLFLRAIGLIYFSAFYSLLFQVRGLLGPDGILPVAPYLQQIAQVFGGLRYWYVPSLLWLGSSDRALMALCWLGLIASLLLVLNLWPRAMLVICFVLFLSFVTTAQDFSSYQSDGMLLSAGLVCIFFAPSGLHPGLGVRDPPSRASLFLLQLLWFTIYFESGIAKYLGGDPTWRNLTAIDQYYQNGPLPTWIGWYAQQLPHWFHAGTAVLTLLVELLIVWMAFFPRRYRAICFCIVTPLQIGMILTANYAFLNYLVLALGILLLDDIYLVSFVPERWSRAVLESIAAPAQPATQPAPVHLDARPANPPETGQTSSAPPSVLAAPWLLQAREIISAVPVWLSGLLLAWLLYANLFLIILQVWRATPLPARPVTVLEPFRVVNQYGLFGRMTWKRFEIEFQGSVDGTHWTAYPFRNKPQDLREAPRIYAPYQPRFDWNLWFASLDYWRQNPWVVRVEQLLLLDDRNVLALFKSNPFPQGPPKQVRAVLWQYWFTDRATKRATGMWWRREYQGLYAPALAHNPDGKFYVTAWPDSLPSPP
jgi:Lipase maturation factor